MKKALYMSLALNLEKVIWNWMEKHHDEFASLISKPNDVLSGFYSLLISIVLSPQSVEHHRKFNKYIYIARIVEVEIGNSHQMASASVQVTVYYIVAS